MAASIRCICCSIVITSRPTELLKPLVKLGCNHSEVVYLLRIARESIVSLPGLTKFAIERQATYPYAYERKERAAAALVAPGLVRTMCAAVHSRCDDPLVRASR